MQRSVVADIANRIFGGSTTRLAMQVLSSRKTSPEELELPKGKIVAPVINSAELHLPIGAGESVSVEAGANFTLLLEPNTSFTLHTVKAGSCVV